MTMCCPPGLERLHAEAHTFSGLSSPQKLSLLCAGAHMPEAFRGRHLAALQRAREARRWACGAAGPSEALHVGPAKPVFLPCFHSCRGWLETLSLFLIGNYYWLETLHSMLHMHCHYLRKTRAVCQGLAVASPRQSSTACEGGNRHFTWVPGSQKAPRACSSAAEGAQQVGSGSTPTPVSSKCTSKC